MKSRARLIWEKLHASYWFLPTLTSLLAVGLSVGCLALDEGLRYAALQQRGWVYGGGPAGARAVLATIAGSIITVAGTTFSITIAVLSMAAGQFGPRLLRNFMRDRANQAVLGIFVATFLYCLLVLRTVRGTDNETYVPHLSVTVGVLLAIACLGGLIFFIHHIAESIQVSHVIENVGIELDDAVCRLFPEALGEEAEPPSFPADSCYRIAAENSGYIQEIDEDKLLGMATQGEAILRLLMRPGDYVIEGMTLAEFWGPERSRDEKVIRSAFTLGSTRTPFQDADFAFLQLVELAVRALSPGINDPFTALMCIDRISAALCLLANRTLPAANRLDPTGLLRIVSQPYRYEQLVHSAFSQIRENGKSHQVIVERLRQQIDVVLTRAVHPEFRAALHHERELLSGKPEIMIVGADSERSAEN